MKTETNHGTLKYISELILAILYWLKCHDIGYNDLRKKREKMPFLTNERKYLKKKKPMPDCNLQRGFERLIIYNSKIAKTIYPWNTQKCNDQMGSHEITNLINKWLNIRAKTV